MTDDIHLFMSSHRTDQSRPTHVSLFFPKGRYMIEGSDLEHFWRVYGESYGRLRLGIAECLQDPVLPVIVDVDLRQEDTGSNESLYTKEHVEFLVATYQSVLKEILEDVKDEQLMCFVMEKQSYREMKHGKSFVKNGYHLHFPFLFFDRFVHDQVLLPKIRQICKKNGNKVPTCVKNPENVVDRAYCRGMGIPWLCYGSSKDHDRLPYEVTYCMDARMKTYTDWRPFLLDYRIYQWEQGQWIPIVLTIDNLNEYLPRIFSIQLSGRQEYVMNVSSSCYPVQPFLNKEVQKINHKKVRNEDDSEWQTHVEFIDELLAMLSNDRAMDRNEWMLVGWVLYNIMDGSEDGYNRWVEFSKRCPSVFEEHVCHFEWSRMVRKDLSIGTLKYMARQDNPEKYKMAISKYIRPYIMKCMKLDGTHSDLAYALYKQFESEFVCASLSQKIWYQFQGHTWKQVEEGITLRKRISQDIVKEYEIIGKEYFEKAATADSKEEIEMYKKKANNALKILRLLKSAPYKANIMKEAMEIFYQEDFVKKLDANPWLIAFKNGIYDLKQHNFRQGNPFDFLSIHMNIDYKKDLTMEDERVKDVLDFFEKIFPDKSVREYFLDISAEVFIGGNTLKIVQVWSGEGDNGKSIMQTLFEKMLGPYAIKLPTSLITGKRTQSSAACPELVRAGNGVRMAMLQEPDQKDEINIGILKELSGNDTFFARGLYKEGQEITPMFKLVLTCNDLPKITSHDKATWNRIRVIPFESTFCDDAPHSIEEQLLQKRFPKNETFGDKIPFMVEAFAWLLIQRYKALRSRSKVRHEPEKVRLATANYRKKNDLFRQFVEECVETAATADDSVSVSELYSCFKDWFRESQPKGSLPSKIELKEYFTKLWGGPSVKGTVWKGRALVVTDEEHRTDTLLPLL